MKTTVNVEIDNQEIVNRINKAAIEARNAEAKEAKKYIREEVRSTIKEYAECQVEKLMNEYYGETNLERIVRDYANETFKRRIDNTLQQIVRDVLRVDRWSGNRRYSYEDAVEKTEDYKKGFEDGINSLPFVILTENKVKLDQHYIEDSLVEIIGRSLTHNLRANNNLMDKLARKVALEIKSQEASE